MRKVRKYCLQNENFIVYTLMQICQAVVDDMTNAHECSRHSAVTVCLREPHSGVQRVPANDWRAPHQYSGPVIGQTELSIKKFCTRRLPFYIFRIQGIHALMRRAPPTPSEPQLNSVQLDWTELTNSRARRAGVLEYFTVLMQGIKIKWKCLFWPELLLLKGSAGG